MAAPKAVLALLLATQLRTASAVHDCGPVPGNTGSGSTTCPSTRLGGFSLNNQTNWYTGAVVNININSSSIVFPAIGDWGRANSWIGTLIGNPECTASNFFLGDDELFGGAWQAQDAQYMNTVCAARRCNSVIISVGDQFYDCGADDAYTPAGVPARLQTDWYNVYQNPSVTPAIANLPWYSVVGNHEGPTQGGMDKLIYDYPAMNSNWQMPSRYYALNLIGNGVSVKILVLNVFPCITGYPTLTQNTTNAAGAQLIVKANTKYGSTLEYKQTNTSQYISSMLSWAQAQLANNNATYTILATHFPLFGGKIQNGDSTAVFGTGTATKGVLPAYPGNFGCFATLNGLVQQYKPQFYINGHDHTQTVAVNSVNATDTTLYVTTGAGAQISQIDGFSPNNANSNGTNLRFSGVQLDSQGNNVTVANGGFTLFTATASSLKMEMMVTQNGWNYPMACDYAYYAGYNAVTPNAGTVGKLVSTIYGAAYPAATGIPTSLGYQVTGPYSAGCISCANASADATGTYSAVCSSAAYPNAVAGTVGAINRGFIVPFAGVNTTVVMPTTGMYTCTVPPGAGMMPACTCNAPNGLYTACRGITPPSPPPSPPSPPPSPPIYKPSAAPSSGRKAAAGDIVAVVLVAVAAALF